MAFSSGFWQSPRREVAFSEMTLAQVIFPRDTNVLGRATAGVILKAIDIAASLTASKHTGQKVVTASLDCMDFINPANLWELLTTRCRMTRTWTSSLEVEVTVLAESVHTGEKRTVAVAYLVFVALGEDLKPIPVPELPLITPEEETRSGQADQRRRIRLAEADQGLTRAETRIEPGDPLEEFKRTMTPDDANIHHNVFGGVILELIHQVGEQVAIRHANGPVVSVRQDRMSFDQPAYIGEEVRAQAVITRSWTSSMEVQVDVTATDHKTRVSRQVASSYLVFIAQDRDGRPTPVKPFEPASEKQQKRWEEAGQRREVRLSARRKS